MLRQPALRAQLAAHFAAHFPEADLDGREGSCIPHESTAHLRFELGEPHHNGTDERVRQSADRAAQILEACFQPNDPVILLVMDYGKSFWGDEPDYLYGLIDPTAIARSARHKLGKLMPGNRPTKKRRARQNLFLTRFAAIRHRELLAGIANLEQGRKPKVGQRVYFIHPTRPLAFHMYDDRGCFLFANANTLGTVNDRFPPWVMR